MAEERDGWSKAQIAFAAVGSVVMPVVLLAIGHRFTSQQEVTAEATRQAERLTSLLRPLASDNPRERRLATEIAGYLAQNGQLPLELVPVLANTVRDDPSSATAQAASQALARVEENNPQLRSQIQADFKVLQARVYFHITTEPQRAAAQRLASQLVSALGSDFVVPGIERVAGPSRSELRVFKSEDRPEAEKIAESLRRLGVQLEVRDLSPRYQKSEAIRPRHYELWLGPDFS